ncbi:MAG TPA: hypothetical protein VGF40_13675 [Thermoanaerobaculia bacterium]
MKTLIASFAIALVLLAVSPAVAQENLEPVRQDLLRYVQALQKLPPAVVAQWGDGRVDLAAAETSIRNLTPEELATLGSALDRMPYWNEVLGVLETAHVVPRSDVMNVPEYSEFVSDIARKNLLSLMDMFAKVPGGSARPGYLDRIARTKAAINQLSPEELLELHARVQAAAPAWRARLAQRVSGEGPVQGAATWYTCEDPCDYTGLEYVWCNITSTLDCVGDLAVSVAQWVVDTGSALITGIGDFLGDFAESVLPSEEDFLSMMADAGAILAQIPDYIRLPCMEDGSQFTFFGEVGTLPAAHKWERTVAFLGNVGEEALPDDVWSGNLKSIAAVVNFVPQHILSCFQDAYEARFAEDQETHREWVTDNLDVVASTRASQLRVNDAQTAATDVIGDVANLEAKLDALGAEVDDIGAIQIRKRTLLGAFRDEALRLHIEVDLLRQSNFRIGLFELPASAGGHLEAVIEIVASTLASRQAAGVDVKKAIASYQSGVAAFNAGNYKEAYGWMRQAYQRSVM